MKIIEHLTQRLVARSPVVALKALQSHQGELWIARALNQPGAIKWRDITLPPQLNGFEDLTFLFTSSPLNRRFIRLDIDEAAALYKIIKSLPSPHGIEIGRFKGGSTVMLTAAVGPDGHLLSIDNEPQDDDGLEDILSQANLRNRVELLVADANQVQYDLDIDFVFIDGDHSYEGARQDHNKWGSKVRPGGFIIHHDMGNARPLSSQWDSLAKLKFEIECKQQQVLELFQEVGSLVIFKRFNSSWKPV